MPFSVMRLAPPGPWSTPNPLPVENLRLRTHIRPVQGVLQRSWKIRLLLVKEGLSVGHVPGMKESHLFHPDPLCRAVHEHFVAADGKITPSTFMLRHVLIRVVKRRIGVVTPAIFNSHDDV